MRRPQFRIRTLLWLTLVVAAFLAGMAYGKRLARQEYPEVWLELDAMREAVEVQQAKFGHTTMPHYPARAEVVPAGSPSYN